MWEIKNMPAGTNRVAKTIGAVLYGLVAGIAAAVVIVLGCIFLGFIAGWLLRLAGWKAQGDAATMAGLYYIYYTVPIGFVVGIIVGCNVAISRLQLRKV
jgi:hypothetical protein